jgi:sulfur relay protein TusB/DsrH
MCIVHALLCTFTEIDYMIEKQQDIDIGLLITKTPLESDNVSKIIYLAKEAIANWKKVQLYLISDGVWLAKSGQQNKVAEKFEELIKSGVSVIVSGEHLEAAGITKNEVTEGIEITDDPYTTLVNLVMEKWKKVISI